MKTLLKRLLSESSDNILIQLFRYGFVGGVAFVVDFGLLAMFTELCGLPYLVSACLSFIAGLSVNYAMSIKWVFNQSEDLSAQQRTAEFIVFAAIGVIGLGLNALIMWVSTEFIGFHYLVSKVVSTVTVFFWNFLARRTFVNSMSKLIYLCNSKLQHQQKLS